MKKLLRIGAMLFLAAALAGCTTTRDAGKEDSDNKNNENSKKNEKVLRLNNGNEPTSFDPPVGFDSVSWQALNNIMEGLTRLDENHMPQPATAAKWEVSDDGKTYTFYIRESAKWSNGEPVTAGDFEFAWKRLLDPKTASPAAFLAYFIEGAEDFYNGEGSKDNIQVKAVNDQTLVVTLTSPQAYFLSVIANPCFFPIHQKTAENNPQWYAEAETFVANGPFKLTEWVHDSHFIMEKNDQYWDVDQVKLDKIHWGMIDETNTEYQMFQRGELDTAAIPPDLSEQILAEGKAGFEEQAGIYFYRFNVNMEPFQNRKIRKAFAMAINQQQIVDYVTKSKEKAAHAFVSYGFQEPSGKEFRDVGGDLVVFDAEEAKALLKKGMKEEGYTELPEMILTYNTSEAHKKIAETLQEMINTALDVDIKLANMEWNVFTDEQKALKLQLSRGTFLADYADPINFLENFQTGHTMNRTGWSNATYDQLIREAKKEGNEAKRFQIMHEAEKILFEDMPIFPVHFYNQTYLQHEKVKGIIRHPVGYIELKWADIDV
ncbi:peptide ABC transporter substrate-binding protein [Bacillus chungangensis]|uniref:Dipeptide transport system substrate-binding protein n=1 Tax=Bacillus chungangensis TaxID=587633 RepID=A0ABT9WPG3_9BACI|nr:peptide ABC transporter substrate-binding protein [Bacillus chungangensis]MDQ0174842.1 dipeptide transport system substrate-binding protein [Bacillus chungangensis]